MSENFEVPICSKCGVNCCHEGTYITPIEFEKLPEEIKKLFIGEKFLNGYRIKGERCSFLGKDGCIIPQDIRPIECKLFPYEISTLCEIIINPQASLKCPGLKIFQTDEYKEKCLTLLKECVENGIVTQEDVDSIRQNKYEL